MTMEQNPLSEVTIDFFGLIAFRAESDVQTKVVLLRGETPEHHACLAVPVDAVELGDGLTSPLPRAVHPSGPGLRLFSLRDYRLAFVASAGAAHGLGRLISLEDAFNYGDGGSVGKYEVNWGSPEIVSDITLTGGELTTRADPPFTENPVTFTTNLNDPNAAVGPQMMVHTVVVWKGVIPSILRVESRREGGPSWSLHLRQSAHLSIYSLPSSAERVDTDLGHFTSIFKLLVTQPPRQVFPGEVDGGGTVYGDYPSCIPPTRL
jgi:hypothetical protein